MMMSLPVIERAVLLKMLTYSALYAFTVFIFYSSITGRGSENNDLTFFRLFIICFASILLVKYFFYMFLSPIYDISRAYYEKTHEKESRTFNPKVSIIIPCWNEEIGILTTIKSILASSYRSMEIIIINDGSTDQSDTIIRAFIKNHKKRKGSGISLVYHYQKNGGKGRALNSGLLRATGDIIMSIDADCLVMRDAVKNFVRCFKDPSVMAAVGNVKIGNTHGLIGTVQALEFLFSFYFKKADSFMNTIYIIGGAAGAFRKEVFMLLGPYSTDNITEDIELSVRIQEYGLKIVYAADAIIYTEGASDIGGLLRQRLRWKRGRIETFQEHKKLFFSFKKNHNKLLTTLILPLAIFGDIQLFFEPIFLFFLYVYSYLTNDFSSFISGVVVVSSMFFVQLIFDSPEQRRLSFILLAPIGWLLFYIASYVEYYALIKAFWGLLTNQECRWQHWQRTGVVSNNSSRVRV